MKQIDVAIIAAGGAGQAHFWRFEALPAVKVKTVFDIDEKNLLDLSKTHPETKVTTDCSEIIEDENIDVVSICSPDHTHFDYAIDAILARKHVLVEKPLVTSLEQCKKLEAAVLDQDYDKVFGVHHQLRYVPCWRSARELVQNHDLGLPLIIEAEYVHDLRDRATKFDDWRMRKESVQKIALGASCHTIDLMRWVLDSDVKEVFSYASDIGWPDYPDIDTVVTLLKFDNGAIGKAISTFACQRPELYALRISATNGTVNNNLLIEKSGFNRFVCPSLPGIRQRIRKSILDWILTRSPLRGGPIQNYPYSVYNHDVACRALISEFISCVRSGLGFPIDFSEGAYTTQLCLASIESYEKGRPIKVDRAF